jgi:carbamoyltransferase
MSTTARLKILWFPCDKLMNILGVSAGFHDAAITLLSRQGEILFAAQSERYSKIKGDSNICQGLVEEIRGASIDTISYYETPWKKQLRCLYSGQGIEWDKLSTRSILKNQLQGPYNFTNGTKIVTCGHHLSHAAAGFQTSPFERATVVVVDAIGEWDTISIWAAEYDKNGFANYKKLWGQTYPHSIGLFYSAVTKRVGLKPNDEEYILMGMSAYGNKNLFSNLMERNFIRNYRDLSFNENLHIGILPEYLEYAFNEDLAAAAQYILERAVNSVMEKARNFCYSDNLVYMGGVALNCLANRNLGEYFDNIWIMPSPGDSGSSLGAAALAFRRRIHWVDAYLGHQIAGPYPVDDALSFLLSDSIVGVANGRAEFGPRALGNRSLLADPRGPDIKDKVNCIKKRQKFRPFAPVILEELADQYFEISPNWNTRYMQSVSRCKYPESYPAIVHIDNTSRVQTVPRNGSGIRRLLEKWYEKTNCPMLLNTSLNIRGEPIVNDIQDAKRFENLYNVKVLN